MPATWGIDLGSSLIKIGNLGGKKVNSLAAISNPLGKIQIDTEMEINTLATEIKKALSDGKIDAKQFRVVIPDSLAYFRVISLPVLSDAELASAIRYEAEQYVPVKLDDVELSWDVIERPKDKAAGDKMQVLLVAAVRENVAKIVELLGRTGLEVETVEPEIIAASKSLIYGKNLVDGTILCLMGASGMSISMYTGEKLIFVYRYGSGGTALTRAISATLQLTMPQAEEYKRAYGVSQNVLEGKLALAMAPVLDGMISEIKKAQSFFMQSSPGVKLGRIVLGGGTALMPSLVQLLTSKLGLEVTLGDPFTDLSLASENLRSNAALYPAVIGTLKD